MNNQDWKTGEGYPNLSSSLDAWRMEFLKRSDSGLAGHPHFKLEDGSVELFAGPSIIQIETDGSLLSGPDASRSNASRMVLEFQLDQNIDAQLDIARRWLNANQIARYSIDKKRKRVEKYGHYLRAIDASIAGESQSGIASILYPHMDAVSGAKQVSNALKAAKKLISTGSQTRLKRK